MPVGPAVTVFLCLSPTEEVRSPAFFPSAALSHRTSLDLPLSPHRTVEPYLSFSLRRE